MSVAVHSAAAVAEHNSLNDCWLVVRGIVYDVTSFIMNHPGGAAIMLPWAGGDATRPYEETRHSMLAAEVLESLRIGVLAGGHEDPNTDSGAIQPSPDADSGSMQPSPATPNLFKPAGSGGWQMFDCPMCGPVCKPEHQPDPAVIIVAALKQGDAAARMGQWSEALMNYHQAIGAVRKSTDAETIAAVRVGASLTQRKLGSLRSALRHADLAVASCGGGAAHAARGAALEALGLVVDAHIAFSEAARLESTQPSHADAAVRLLPLRHLLAVEGGGEGGAEPVGELPPLTSRQHKLVERLRRDVAARVLSPQLLPLPTPARVLNDDEFESSPWRARQMRCMALLGVDAAVEAARAAHGGHNACDGVREWLVRKAADLGLDVVGELVRAALEADEEPDGSDDGSSSCAQEEEDEDEGPMGSEEVCLPGAFGRCLVQLELAPRRHRLTLSLVSLNSADLGEASLKYTFAVGLSSAYLLEAQSVHTPYFEFVEWRPAERGALEPVEGLPPLASVERRARAYIDFFRSGEGAHPPAAPREMPPVSSFDAVSAEAAVECT